jgi:uncharacterized membrane protein (UPF0127 family)
VAVVAGSCSSGSDSGAPVPGSSATERSVTAGSIVPAPAGFRAVTVTVRRADGTTTQRCLLLADTPALREQGLMGVTDPELGGYDGMLFDLGGTFSGGFWMKDTLIPLSIAFATSSGAVVSTADMVPCPDGPRPCPVTTASAPSAFAVEVPLGGLPEVGLTDGASFDPVLGPACEVDPASPATTA